MDNVINIYTEVSEIFLTPIIKVVCEEKEGSCATHIARIPENVDEVILWFIRRYSSLFIRSSIFPVFTPVSSEVRF